MTALIDSSLTEKERETLLEEFGEHLQTRLLFLQYDVNPFDSIFFCTLAPRAREAFVQELRRRATEANEALACLCRITSSKGDYEHLIREFVARYRKLSSCGQAIH